MLGPEEERLKRWDVLINTHLNKTGQKVKYMKFYSNVMMGLCVIMYGKVEITGIASKFQSSNVKTGFQGTSGNKGAVMLRYIFLQ